VRLRNSWSRGGTWCSSCCSCSVGRATGSTVTTSRPAGGSEESSIVPSAVTGHRVAHRRSGILVCQPPGAGGQAVNDWGNLQGLIPIPGGIYGPRPTVGSGRAPPQPARSGADGALASRARRMTTVLCPVITRFGIAQLFGVLRVRGPDPLKSLSKRTQMAGLARTQQFRN
jgi:hypothetical protein